MNAVLYVWRRRKGAPAHLAAGVSTLTACTRSVTRAGWESGSEIPPGRQLCRQCAGMQRDIERAVEG